MASNEHVEERNLSEWNKSTLDGRLLNAYLFPFIQIIRGIDFGSPWQVLIDHLIEGEIGERVHLAVFACFLGFPYIHKMRLKST